MFQFPSHQSKGGFLFFSAPPRSAKAILPLSSGWDLGLCSWTLFPWAGIQHGSHICQASSTSGIHWECAMHVWKWTFPEKVWLWDLETPAEPLGKKNIKRPQINLPPAVSIALMLHVPWKKVWDAVSFHCVFSQHLSWSSGSVTFLC